MLKAPKLASPLASLAVLICGLPLNGQEPVSADSIEQIVELEPFNVTSDGARTVLEITRQDLDRRQALDLKDSMSLDPSVTVGGSTPIAQKMYVRDMGEGLLNVSIDGATQSGALFHHIGRITIEPELLKRVAVQPGVGNATDGPGTLGGAVRFISKSPEDLLFPGQQYGGMLKAGYFGNTSGYRVSATGYGRLTDRWSALASIVKSDHGKITDGNGDKIEGSTSDLQSILAKVVGRFDNGQRLSLSFENLDEGGEKLRRPEWGPGPLNPAYYMESSRRTGRIEYNLRPEANDVVNMAARLTYTDGEITQIGPWGPWTGNISSLQALLQNAQVIGRHNITYGLDYRTDDVTAGPPENTSEYQEDNTVLGLFAQGNAVLTDQLFLNAGVRYDDYELTDQLQQDFSHSGFSPNASLTYNVNSEFRIIGNVASALRGPGINDAFKIDAAENDPDLNAERAVNYELRLHYAAKGLQLEAGVFSNTIDDIITNTLPWSSYYTNAGELKSDGFFARIGYTTAKYHLSLQHNRTETTLDGQVATRYQYGSLVSRIGPTWVADAVWRPLPGLDVGWNGRFVESINGISIPVDITGVEGGTIDKPSYMLHDFYARWTPEEFDNVTFVLTIKNAFDEAYRSHASVEDMTAFPDFDGVAGALEPGRDIRVSVMLRF